jgi:hypothetical protein
VPIPVAARSKAWVCGRSPAGIVGSNATGGMDVCLLIVVFCQVEVSATGYSTVQRSPTDCGASLCVIKKRREWRGPGTQWGLLRHKKKKTAHTRNLLVRNALFVFNGDSKQYSKQNSSGASPNKRCWTIFTVTSKTPNRYAPHNDVSVNDGPYIRQWSYSIIIL